MDMHKLNNIKQIALVFVALFAAAEAMGQSSTVGSSPSPAIECGEYQWPEVQSPCPEVQVKQKHDHTAIARYRHKGWDTVVTCANPQIILSCMPYIPVQRFNGTYYVDQIPYNPPDTTFCLTYGAALSTMNDPNRKRMNITADDEFAPAYTTIPYPFYFFGIRKNQFRLGANGLVTFCDPSLFGSGQHCDYNYSAGIPWADGNTSGPDADGLNRMRDAIYGVFEDTDPRATSTASGTPPNYGIYYGVIDEYPCRKIICSWNEMVQFGHNDKRCTYQIVCYEGSNIIEVHVKKREYGSSTSGGRGVIGIQNATGVAQVASSTPTDPNSSPAINGKPPAFAPTGYNTTTSTFQNIAFRFTPAGTTAKNYGWRRIYDDGRPDVELRNIAVYPEAMDDSCGYYEPMDDANTCPTLTKAYVSPKEPAKYVFYLRFLNANNDQYVLTDTIFIGVDTVNYLDIHKLPINDTLPGRLDICLNDTARMRLDITALQEITHEEWLIRRVSGGDTITLDSLVADNHPGQVVNLSNNYISFDPRYTPVQAFRIQGNDTTVMDTTLFSLDDYDLIGDTILTRKVFLFSRNLPTQGLQANKIDTILIQVTSDFASGCHNYDTFMLRVFPNFDTVIADGICQGETFTWDTNGSPYKTFTQPTNPQTEFVLLHSTPGCDSLVHLQLTVSSVSHSIDHQEDCKPYTWLNGKTYSTSNVATAATDTIVLKNRYDCDSIVQLELVIHPLTAKLRSNIDHFTLDNLDAVLTDISIGGGSRVWKFPNGPDQTGVNAYYSIPADMEGANIILIASSPYGCVDTAKIYIPLNKEHFWVPNAFTPDNPAGNSLFSSVSTKTLKQEMLIYNRRGELVFRCEGADCAWDGRDFDGNPCVQDAYVYIIRYTNEFEPQNTHVLKGTVTLIR